jgi:apolipoprotein N-acyltransferase
MKFMKILMILGKINISWKLILAGIVTGLSLPPTPFGFLAWVGLVPLIDSWLKSPSPLRSAYYGFLWSLGYLFVGMYWLAFNNGTFWWAASMSMIAAVLFLSLNYMLIGWWFGWLHRKLGRITLWILPMLWISVEFLRSFGSLGFPWIALANSQTGFFLPIQNAEIVGIYGLSFWVVFLNVLLIELWHSHTRWIPGCVLIAVFGLPWLSGLLLVPDVPEPSLRVGIVQPNVNAADKWLPEIRHQHIAQLIRLTSEVAVDSPDIVFWPEAATPAYLRRGGKRYLQEIQEELRLLKFPVVTGMPDYNRQVDGKVRYYNAVGFIDSAGLHPEQYNKIQLVPMGEYIPLSKWIPALNSLNLGQGNFTHGMEYTVFEVDSIPFSVSVCFETTFPGLNRQFVRRGATFLASVVNDAWYQTSSGPFQHATQSRYRAIEFRRPVVRAANTGISLVIDQTGKIVSRLGLNREGVIAADIAPANELTFYTRFGDIFAWLNVIVMLGLTVYSGKNWLRRKIK